MYKQYQLPYAYEALEPHIDALTMETHYSKHHAAYTKNLNDAAEKAGVAGRDITELLANLDSIADSGLRKAIRNNGGGYYNHNLYFSTISPDGGGEPEGALAQALTREFGGFAAFKEQLSALALGQFGSGWAWLSAAAGGKLLLSASHGYGFIASVENMISRQKAGKAFISWNKDKAFAGLLRC